MIRVFIQRSSLSTRLPRPNIPPRTRRYARYARDMALTCGNVTRVVTNRDEGETVTHKRPDTLCSRCGRLLWTGSGSLLAKFRVCRQCRRVKPAPYGPRPRKEAA